jgi:hypothetical protein
MFDLSPSGLGNSKHTASPNYHAPLLEVCPGLYATCVWNSPSRTGLSSSYCAALAFMKSGPHPEHMMLQCDNSSHKRQEWCYMESQSPVDLISHVLKPQGDIDQENKCCTKFPWVSCVSWGSYVYEFWHKAIFQSTKLSWHEIILWLTELVPGVHLITRD